MALRPGWLVLRPVWLALRPFWLAPRPCWLAWGGGNRRMYDRTGPYRTGLCPLLGQLPKKSGYQRMDPRTDRPMDQRTDRHLKINVKQKPVTYRLQMFSSVLVLLQLDSQNSIFINLCQVFSEKTPVMSVDICIRISVLINNKNSDKNNNNNNNNNKTTTGTTRTKTTKGRRN